MTRLPFGFFRTGLLAPDLIVTLMQRAGCFAPPPAYRLAPSRPYRNPSSGHPSPWIVPTGRALRAAERRVKHEMQKRQAASDRVNRVAARWAAKRARRTQEATS